jgi:hypothetical protein
VFRNGVSVGSVQLNDAAVGGVNLNSALLQTINLVPLPSTGFRTGDLLSMRLSARIAASSPNKNGTIRLWYNDTNVNSNFAATIGNVASSYYLRSGSLLTTAPGSGPTASAETTVKRTGGNPFTTLGTWSITYWVSDKFSFSLSDIWATVKHDGGVSRRLDPSGPCLSVALFMRFFSREMIDLTRPKYAYVTESCQPD